MINGVQFDEPGMEYRAYGAQQNTGVSSLTQMVIKMGLAKDAKQAGVVLVVIGLMAIMFAYFMWPSGSSSQRVPQPGDAGYEAWVSSH